MPLAMFNPCQPCCGEAGPCCGLNSLSTAWATFSIVDHDPAYIGDYMEDVDGLSLELHQEGGILTVQSAPENHYGLIFHISCDLLGAVIADSREFDSFHPVTTLMHIVSYTISCSPLLITCHMGDPDTGHVYAIVTITR